MVPSPPVSTITRNASNQAQTDPFMSEDERYERVYQHRKARFQTLQKQQDISRERIFILSGDKAWGVFRNGYTSEGRLQRRKLVFERCRNFPALHQACISGNRNHIRTLLNTPGVCVLERDACGRIALHHAVINEHYKIIKKLLRRRDATLQAHVRDNSSRTALHYALEKIEILARHRQGLNNPALITREMRVESKRYRRLWELAGRILDKFSQRDLEDEKGGESIKVLDLRCRGDVWDVCRSGDVERLETILKAYGCSKNEWELSELKRTLLHEACENQQLQVIYFLTSMMEIPVLAQDSSGCTALHCAARRGHLNVCQMLLGKPVNDEIYQLNDSTEELVLLQDIRGRTALHWCLLGAYNPLIRLQLAVFLAQSSPVVLNIYDHDGVSPLHLAIWRGEIELVQEFITLGANVCASSRILQPPYDKEVDKAFWAPCGIVFQRRCHRKFKKIDSRRDSTDTVADITSIPACSKKRTLNWEKLQHPVEAFWYWTQRLNQGNFVSNKKEIDSVEDKPSDIESVDTEDLGCRKYGGICQRCKSFASVITTPSPPKECRSKLLSPLLLALRMCALKVDCGSLLEHRVSIVEILLMSGAPPDESHNDKNVKDTVMQVNSIDSSALSEGLRSALRCPQIIPMLRQYGAEDIRIRDIMRWYLSAPSTAAKQIESVLSQLLELENVGSNSEFLTMLFYQKHFITLCELWLTKADSFTTTTIGDVTTDHWGRGGSPWKCIHETLVSWSEPRKRPVGVGTIDIKHLKFLCGLVSSNSDIPDDKDDILHDRCAWELFEYCVGLFLRQRDNSNLDTSGKLLQEQILLLCIQVLLKCWKRNGDPDERTQSKCTNWLEPSILRGYFDCALVILEALHRLGGTKNLLDKVFELYSSVIGSRSGFEDEQFLNHREFLIVCVENLLKVETTRVVKQTNATVASARSLVHLCANNLALSLVECCFDGVFPDYRSTQDQSNALRAIRSIRVGGKTMIQWILVHDRYDIMQWLLKRVPPGIERGLCWSEFVAASTGKMLNDIDKESKCTASLFSLYLEDVQTHLGLNERNGLLINSIVEIAIPTDSVALLERLLKLSGSSYSHHGETSDKAHITNELKQAAVLHLMARWNAIRIATFLLPAETQVGQANWQQIFCEESSQRHEIDECTPLELCRLLGHNQLFQFLSSRLQPSLPDATDSVESSDTGRDPKENCQVGLLRNIIHINEDLVSQGKVVERFIGYQRIAIIQDPWVSVVAQNQVSHLQAMSLSSHPNISVRTLVVAAIKAASLNALKWILEANTPITEQLSDDEAIECLYAAAKHPGDVYAEMTLLLLENGLNPGRLSGDGMGIPLLHRAACFSSASLAARIMTLLLERPDCDVNALDAFGNTAVSYAVASGRIHNACFLVQNSKCRLEAEYEGQSCFYYTLHLVPSFAWRTIVRQLLVTKRARAFLHCDADSKTCGCKGYEGENQDGDLYIPCGFCGHASMSHHLIPLPSWFRDQYDTYIVANPPRKLSSSSSDKNVDSDDEMSRQFLTDTDEDEEIVLENGRGRLDVQLLKRVTALQYDDILLANGLSGAVAFDVQIAEETVTDSVDCNNCDVTPRTPEKEPVIPDCVTMQEPLLQYADQCVEIYGNGIHRRGRKFTGPWWLQHELTMVHSPRCFCQSFAFVTSKSQLLHVAVCRWLRRTAFLHTHATDTSSGNVTSAIVVLAAVQPAWEHWHGVAKLDRQSVARPLPPLPRILSSVLFHWRYGKQLLAFQRWKNFRTSPEVAHHRLESRLEHVAAEMRRNRFITLQQRQQQLQKSTRSLLSP